MNKCSNDGQNFMKGDFWYYEYPGSIEVILPVESVSKHKNSTGATFIRIPRRQLESSLQRMNASRRKRAKRP